MAEPYNHRAIEQKWRDKWEATPINVNDGKKPKYYCLDMFPYPSGSGLHVGHWRGYVMDIMSFIQWDGMHSDFQQRTMRLRWEHTLKLLQLLILRISRDRLMKSQLSMTGIWK